MNLKNILLAIKNIQERLTKLEKIGIPKDGKTPIKGIDYFDGINGIPGKDGKDGSEPPS